VTICNTSARLFCTFNAQRGNTWIAIPIKEARETVHASLVYVKGMYQRNA